MATIWLVTGAVVSNEQTMPSDLHGHFTYYYQSPGVIDITLLIEATQ